MTEMQRVLIALGLTVFAGMATGIGSLIAFSAKRTNNRFLSVATGFSAGVMLYVSFVEILFKGKEALSEQFGAVAGNWVNAASFFGGMLLIGLIDALVPAAENPHEMRSETDEQMLHPDGDVAAASSVDKDPSHRHLLRTGLFTALAIGIHNFPEGLVTFLTALEDPALGVTIAIAVALHNIPEGISVSVPIYFATGNRRQAFILSFLSGLAEPAGAIIAYVCIRLFLGSGTLAIPAGLTGILFGGVAGIMVYISLDELLPASRAYGKGHDTLIGLVCGMVVMALSLLIMQ